MVYLLTVALNLIPFRAQILEKNNNDFDICIDNGNELKNI